MSALFATVLDESGNPLRSRRGFKVPVGVGLGLHGAAVLVVLAARVWSVEDAPEPPIPIVFHDAGGAPPLGDGGEGEKPRPAAERKTDPSPPQSPPDETPAVIAEIPDKTSAEIGEGQPAGPDPLAGGGTSKNGGTGAPGKPAGQIGGTCEDCEKGGILPLPVGGDVHEPLLVIRVEPAYPELARRTHQEGLVVVAAVISPTGVVEEARIVKSASPLLDSAAVAAVERWRYRPATLYGRPVRVLLSVTVKFSLH